MPAMKNSSEQSMRQAGVRIIRGVVTATHCTSDRRYSRSMAVQLMSLVICIMADFCVEVIAQDLGSSSMKMDGLRSCLIVLRHPGADRHSSHLIEVAPAWKDR